MRNCWKKLQKRYFCASAFKSMVVSWRMMEMSSLMWLSPEIIWASSASNVSNGAMSSSIRRSGIEKRLKMLSSK